MSNLVISRPPQFLDPWFIEIEQVWDEIEASVNDNDARITTLEGLVIGGTGVVTSVSKSGDTQLTSDVTFTGTGSVSLSQVGQNIEIAGTGVTDHGALTGLGDDDHLQYILVAGTRAFSGNQSFGFFQATNFRVENVAVIPAPGNQGRLIFDNVALDLKVDNGTSFVSVGVTDHGFLTGLGDDDHLQYLLVSGARAVTGDFTVEGIYKNQATESFEIQSQEDDGALAVGTIVDTFNNLTVAGAKLVSVRNMGVEKFYIDKDGNISVNLMYGHIASLTSLSAMIDTDNDSIVETFKIEHDSDLPGSGGLLFEVNEAGEAQIATSLRVGSLGVPTATLDVNGDADISGELKFSGSNIISSLSSLTFIIDTNNDETASFIWQEGAGATILQLDEDKSLHVLGTLKGGSPANTFRIEAKRLAGGPSTAIEMDTQVAYSGSDKLLSIKNLGVEKLYIDFDGVIVGGSSPFKFKSRTPTNEGTQATGTITIIDNTFDAGDSVTITDPTLVPFTFTETTDFAIGITANDTASNLAAAINSVYPALSSQVSALAAGNIVTITVTAAGALGNSFALSESDNATDNFTLSGAFFTGGTDVPSVVYEFDSINDHTVAGSKLFSLKRAGVEKFFIDKDGNFSGNFVTTVDPSAGGAGIQAAMNAVNTAGGGIVQLLEGIYVISAAITPDVGMNNVEVRGVGEGTILQHNGLGSFQVFLVQGTSVSSGVAANNVLISATTITTTVAANAAVFLVGDSVKIAGNGDDTFEEAEMNEVAIAGDGGTGIVGLKYPIRRNITSVTLSGFRNGQNNKFKDFRMTAATPFGMDDVFIGTRQKNCELENLFVDSFYSTQALEFSTGWKNKINNCKIKDLVTLSSGVQLSNELESSVEHCTIVGMPVTGIKVIFRSNDNRISNNLITNCVSGIYVDGLSGTRTRRILCSNNKLSEIETFGIRFEHVRDAVVSNNSLDNCAYKQTGGDVQAIYGGTLHNVSILGNNINYARMGISLATSEDCNISNNNLKNIVGAPSSAYGDALTYHGSRGCITGNIIQNCTKAGSPAMEIGGTTGFGLGFIVSNNIVDTINGNGISMFQDSGTGAGHVISGNVIRNIAGSFALVIANGITDSIIMGNNCLGEGISEGTGTGNDFIGNKE